MSNLLYKGDIEIQGHIFYNDGQVIERSIEGAGSFVLNNTHDIIQVIMKERDPEIDAQLFEFIVNDYRDDECYYGLCVHRVNANPSDGYFVAERLFVFDCEEVGEFPLHIDFKN